MKITITRAITELKMLNNRIKKEARESMYFGVQVGNNLVYPTRSIKPEDFKERVKESVQSVEDLIKRATQIKFAIDKSNFSTTVKIGGQEFTVSEVLAMKSLIGNKQEYLDRLTLDYSKATEVMESKERENSSAIDNLVNQEINAAGKSSVGKDDKENILKRYTSMIETTRAVTLLDPENCQKKLKELKEELEVFAKEVDYTLSESNSTTFIEIPD